MVTDPIADMLTRIRNGYMAKRNTVLVPYSKNKEAIINVLIKEGYLKSYEVSGDIQKEIKVSLRYEAKEPAISEIKRVSRPSLRVYVGKTELPKVLGGLGKALISTPKGVMTDRDARKLQLGGEVICEVW